MSKIDKQFYQRHQSVFDSSVYFNYPNSFKKEGEDHININLQSNTTIGLLLTPEYIKVINYPHLGKFSSVLSLWYWVRSQNKDDRIRRMVGNELKSYAEKNKLYKNYVSNFKAIMAKATWIKVKAYPSIIEEIRKLGPDIKLLSYYVVKSSEVRITTKYAEFIISVGNEIIDAVKNDREPNFDFLIDTPEESDMDYTGGILKTICQTT